MTLLRSAQSLEFVRVSVATTDPDGVAVNPTADPVAMAFVPSGEAITGNTAFISAAWETSLADPLRPAYYARLLVGPGAAYVPVAGTRVDAFVSVTDSPEVPKIRAGSIRFE